jgi:hypothetical protein
MSIGPTLQVGAAGAGVAVAPDGADAGVGAEVVGVWALANDAIVITIPVPHCSVRVDFKLVKNIPPKKLARLDVEVRIHQKME